MLSLALLQNLQAVVVPLAQHLLQWSRLLLLVNFFSYRSKKIVTLYKFDDSPTVIDGLIYIADATLKSRSIVPFDSISLPLIIALDDNHLYILNHKDN